MFPKLKVSMWIRRIPDQYFCSDLSLYFIHLHKPPQPFLKM